MVGKIANVTFFCEDPPRLARFWSEVLGYPYTPGWGDEVEAELREAGFTDEDLEDRAEAWDGDPAHQRLYFSRYRHERRQRNRVHLDIAAVSGRHGTREEVDAERDRLLALGATLEKTADGPWGPYDEYCHMMRDPEGNEFCVQ